MEQVTTIAQLNDAITRMREASGAPIALVPTMGALHQGHLSLVQAAIADGHQTVATIFVNPTQFAAHEDLEDYPNTLVEDLEKLRAQGASLVWTPTTDVIYPGSDATRVRLNGTLTEFWEGEFRPHFFEGVATVVAKLLIACRPDAAYFGEKDFQQLKVIQQMAADLLLGVDIIGCPTVREDDGLAMSSRNSYLSGEERKIAPALKQTLDQMAANLRDGMTSTKANQLASKGLLEAGFRAVDYIDLVAADSLLPISTYAPEAEARILAAAFLGDTRLIDNIAI